MPCIMPEQPYCPACEFGRIVQTEDMPDTDCSWECMCTQEKYDEYLLRKLEAQANMKEGRGNLMAVDDILKSCPFCGGQAHISIDTEAIIDSFGRLWAYTVVCRHCHATSGLYHSAEKAAESWNRRVIDANA